MRQLIEHKSELDRLHLSHEEKLQEISGHYAQRFKEHKMTAARKNSVDKSAFSKEAEQLR